MLRLDPAVGDRQHVGAGQGLLHRPVPGQHESDVPRQGGDLLPVHEQEPENVAADTRGRERVEPETDQLRPVEPDQDRGARLRLGHGAFLSGGREGRVLEEGRLQRDRCGLASVGQGPVLPDRRAERAPRGRLLGPVGGEAEGRGRGGRARDRVQPGRARARVRRQRPQPLQGVEDHGPGPGHAVVRHRGQTGEAGRVRRPLRRRVPHERVHPGQGGDERPRGLLHERGRESAGVLGGVEAVRVRSPQIRHVLRRVDKHGARFLGLAVRWFHFLPAWPLPPEISGRSRGRQGGQEQEGLPPRQDERAQPLRDGQFHREPIGRVHSAIKGEETRSELVVKRDSFVPIFRGNREQREREREAARGLSLFLRKLRVIPPASVRVG